MKSIGSSSGAFWSSETLRERLPCLIENYDPDSVVTSHYELAMGREFYVSPDAGSLDASIQTVKTLKTETQECFTIPPGQFAYLITAETVTVPNDALAFISLKTDVKWKGLINVSGFHVDPGFSGKLIYTVFNAGPASIHLRSGEHYFYIWYAYLDKATADKRNKPGLQHIDQSKIMPGEVPSVVRLHQRIQVLESLSKYYLLVAGLVATVTASGAFLLLKYVFHLL